MVVFVVVNINGDVVVVVVVLVVVELSPGRHSVDFRSENVTKNVKTN